jgi:hypothetical protein
MRETRTSPTLEFGPACRSVAAVPEQALAACSCAAVLGMAARAAIEPLEPVLIRLKTIRLFVHTRSRCCICRRASRIQDRLLWREGFGLVIQPNQPWAEKRPKERWCILHFQSMMAGIHANVAPAAVKPLAPASVCVRVGHSNKLMPVK